MIARGLIAAGLLLLGFDAADFTVTGLAVLAVVLLGLGLWVNQVFSRDVWVCDDETSARLSLVDEELDLFEPRRAVDVVGQYPPVEHLGPCAAHCPVCEVAR